VKVFARCDSIVFIVVTRRSIANIIDFIAFRRVFPSPLLSPSVTHRAVTIIVDLRERYFII